MPDSKPQPDSPRPASPQAEPEAGLTRRHFVQASAAFAALPLISSMSNAQESEETAPTPTAALDKIEIGLVGCGGRGSGAARQALAADPGVVLTAMADVFPERIESSLERISKEAPEQVQVPEERRFVGFDAFQRLIDSGVDVVLLATPPGFRPEHLEAAIAANKHVFCEKPMAVDAPGVRKVLEVAATARKKKLSIVSGFCWRYSAAERATMQQIHDGALGDIRAVYTTYNASPLHTNERKPEWTDVEFQLRNWHHFNWLSGDHIVEQACHSIDKMAWAMNGELPDKAHAVGGRIAREGEPSGHIYDHFAVTYEYPSGARGFHMCRQISGAQYDNSDLILGEKGVCEISGWAPRHVIRGENSWRYTGEKNDMYQQEHDELFKAIRAGEPMNDGDWMAYSTLLSIMGRMAAYTGQTVTWEQAFTSKEELSPDPLDWGSLAVPPVAIPGKSKLV